MANLTFFCRPAEFGDNAVRAFLDCRNMTVALHYSHVATKT